MTFQVNKVLKSTFLAMFLTFFQKFIQIFGQFIIALFLLEKDFGLAALAMSFSKFSTALITGSLRDLSIHLSPDKNNNWSELFKFSFIINSLNGLLILLVAWPISIIYSEKQLFTLLIILSLTRFINITYTIDSSKILIDQKFDRLNLVMFIQGITQTFFSLILAWQGWGAKAIILPIVATSLIGMILVRPHGPKINLNLFEKFSFQKYFKPYFVMMVVGGSKTWIDVAPLIIIGLFQSTEYMGIYYMAYILSTQIVFIAAMNLKNILFTSLKTISDQVELTHIVLRGLEIISLICIPIVTIQYFRLDAIASLFLPNRWMASIPIAKILSFSMVLSAPMILYSIVALSLGDIHKLARNLITQVIIFSISLSISSATLTSDEIPYGVLISSILCSMCAIYQLGLLLNSSKKISLLFIFLVLNSLILNIFGYYISPLITIENIILNFTTFSLAIIFLQLLVIFFGHRELILFISNKIIPQKQ